MSIFRSSQSVLSGVSKIINLMLNVVLMLPHEVLSVGKPAARKIILHPEGRIFRNPDLCQTCLLASGPYLVLDGRHLFDVACCCCIEPLLVSIFISSFFGILNLCQCLAGTIFYGLQFRFHLLGIQLCLISLSSLVIVCSCLVLSLRSLFLSDSTS